MKIKSIETVEYSGDTYNLHIKDNHNYYANGINVSNCHNAKSNIFSQIILPAAVNCKYRIGLTGTMPPGYADKLEILGSIGPHKKFVNAKGLIDRGLATPVEIKMLFLNYSEQDKEFIKKLPKSNKYQEENKWLGVHPGRNRLLAKYTNKISQSGNTLVMFEKIDHGKTLMEEFLKNKFNLESVKFMDKITPKYLKGLGEDIPEKIFINTTLEKRQLGYIEKAGIDPSIFEALEQYDVFLIYGSIDSNEREKIRNILEEKEGAVVFASFGTFSTGVNIKRIYNIILASSTKSPVRLQQTVGRGMRKFSKKEWVKIWDFIDDLSRKNKNTGKIIESSRNYSLKHADERMALYMDNGYPINDLEINLK